MTTRSTAAPRRPVREPRDLFPAGEWLCLAAGGLLTLLGVLGFIPGITQHYDTLFTEPSQAVLLGVFQVSLLYNGLNLVFGIAGVLAGRRKFASRWYLAVAGVLLLGLWIYGFVPTRGSGRGILPLNEANIWLYFGLGFAMIAVLMLSFGAVAKRPR